MKCGRDQRKSKGGGQGCAPWCSLTSSSCAALPVIIPSTSRQLASLVSSMQPRLLRRLASRQYWKAVLSGQKGVSLMTASGEDKKAKSSQV